MILPMARQQNTTLWRHMRIQVHITELLQNKFGGTQVISESTIQVVVEVASLSAKIKD